jgi:hypothetical protein
LKNTNYYLLGYGGLLARGLDVTGRQLVDEFKAMPFYV